MILRNYIHIQPQYFSPDDLAQITACANNHELMDAKVGAPTGDDADGKIENEIRSSQRNGYSHTNFQRVSRQIIQVS